jgi:hypothetical protein
MNEQRLIRSERGVSFAYGRVVQEMRQWVNQSPACYQFGMAPNRFPADLEMGAMGALR